MYAYILSTAKKLEPFGEHPRDCLIGNRSLEHRQDDALRSLGISPLRVADAGSISDPNAHLVLEDRLYFTPELIAEFVAKSRVPQNQHTLRAEAGARHRAYGGLHTGRAAREWRVCIRAAL